jgi:hypothetical protein
LAQRIIFIDNVDCVVFFDLIPISDDQFVIKVYIL